MRGIIVYEGPSEIDGTPVVAIITGLRPSTNTGTGQMSQLWILLQDQHPHEAVSSGADRAICGDCAFRKGEDGRGCYVTLMAPGSIWTSYKSGLYTTLSEDATRKMLLGIPWARRLRVGAYGDPAAIPVRVLENLLGSGLDWTGYTSSWQTRPDLAKWCMASVRSPAEHAEAVAMGFRTFRVRTSEQEVLNGEIICPKTPEGGQKVQCTDCMLCNGQGGGGKNIVAVVHGGTGTLSAGKRVLNRLAVLS